jgi:hypothetical protein
MRKLIHPLTLSEFDLVLYHHGRCVLLERLTRKWLSAMICEAKEQQLQLPVHGSRNNVLKTKKESFEVDAEGIGSCKSAPRRNSLRWDEEAAGEVDRIQISRSGKQTMQLLHRSD